MGSDCLHRKEKAFHRQGREEREGENRVEEKKFLLVFVDRIALECYSFLGKKRIETNEGLLILDFGFGIFDCGFGILDFCEDCHHGLTPGKALGEWNERIGHGEGGCDRLMGFSYWWTVIV